MRETFDDNDDTALGGSDGTFKTTQPVLDPVVVALGDDDPGRAFLDHMRHTLLPGAWEFPIDDGFAWIPYRLQHSIECFHNPDGRLVARSTIVVVENVDEGAALNIAAYLNQRSFGGAVWFEPDDGSLRVTTAAHLDASSWWDAYVFATTVPRLVGICEQLAPRLAPWVDGSVAVASHPTHGERSDPDQFFHEHHLDTFAPEAGAGLWWSPQEVLAFREIVEDFVALGGVAEWPADPVDDTILFESMGADVRYRINGSSVGINVAEVDHPDLGLGMQVLVTSSVQFRDADWLAWSDDVERLTGMPPDRLHEVLAQRPNYLTYKGIELPPEPPSDENSWDALLAASELNRYLANACPVSLTVAGWTVWGGQLHLAAYLRAEVTRMLQSASSTTVGQAFALLATRMAAGSTGPLPGLLDHLAITGWVHTDGITWRGVDENAGSRSLLVDDADLISETIAAMPVNRLLDEPVELGERMWTLQHSQVLLSMGIFNPAGPSVGTIEAVIDYTIQRAMLIERLRHPFSPAMRLWGVLDQHGFADLGDFVERLIPRLEWSTFEWARVLARDSDVGDAVGRGLLEFARRPGHDSARLAQELADGIWNPWARVGHDYEPSESLASVDGDPAELWRDIATHPQLVDTSLAYLRSAWQGALAYQEDSGDPSTAQRWVSTIGQEIEDRRAGLQAPSPEVTDGR